MIGFNWIKILHPSFYKRVGQTLSFNNCLKLLGCTKEGKESIFYLPKEGKESIFYLPKEGTLILRDYVPVNVTSYSLI